MQPNEEMEDNIKYMPIREAIRIVLWRMQIARDTYDRDTFYLAKSWLLENLKRRHDKGLRVFY